ncbi:MAG TPA: hypothetical protein VGO93_19140 [Candidatus Xenobia bacterium]|jgi:hypothetical protein
MKRNAGVTIFELLMTCALILIVFNLAYSVLMPSLHIWITNESQAAIEDSAVVLESRIGRELERSGQASVAVLPGVAPALQAFSFASLGNETQTDISDNPWSPAPDSFDPQTGRPEWQYFVVYYVPAGSQTVYRKIWPWPVPPKKPIPVLSYTFPTNNVVQLSAADLQTLCDTPNGSERQVASYVTALQLTPFASEMVGSNPVTWASNVELSISMSAPAPGRRVGLSGAVINDRVETRRTQQVYMRM